MNAKTETRVQNAFEELSAVDCSAYTEKKGKFTYLSWTFAVSELLKRHPTATWRVVETADGIPYWTTGAGTFVKVGVTVDGIERVQIHPVLNSNNKTIDSPNAFEINTSIQRALVKAIALHGLGLYIYAGEDLPEAAQAEKNAQAEAQAEAEAALCEDWLTAIDAVESAEALGALAPDIAKLPDAIKPKLRAAFAARKHAFDKGSA